MKFSHRDESEDWNFFEGVMENPWMYLTKSDIFILFQHTLEILCLNSQLVCKCEKLIMLKLGKKSIEYLPCPWYSMLSLIPLETKWISFFFFFSFMAHLYLPVGILKDDGDDDDDDSKHLL